MKKIITRLCLAGSTLILVSCGGGGGGNDTAFFAGVWSGYLNLVEDQCGIVTESYLSFTHLVNQVDSEVVVDNGITTFSGTVRTNNSFEAQAERPFRPLTPGASCSETITWLYQSLNEDSNTADFVVRHSLISCTTPEGTTQCQFAFSGSGTRINSDQNGPRPIVQITAEGGVPNEASLY